MKIEIPYTFIDEAIRYYRMRGFAYLELPWVVSAEALNITLPESMSPFTREGLVASGEQSFMEHRLKGNLPDGRFVCATPCYRPQDKGRSHIHWSQFYKVELIHLMHDKRPNDQDYDLVIKTALGFMSRYRSDIEVVQVEDDKRKECKTLISHDIQTTDGVEFGSYGIRHHEKIGYWVYGTGVAVPRFQTQELTL